MACVRCAAPLSGQQRRFCSDKCRYSWRDEQKLFGYLTCAICATPMWHGKTSLPQGEATCHPCRRLLPRTPQNRERYKTPCADCGTPSWGERCRACRDKTQVRRSIDDPYRTRALRERAAPGLTAHQRRVLLTAWKRQLRRCVYCMTAPADSVDHVIPLVRGGTNHEGNLAPCCQRCNSSKSGYMLSEWRYGKRLPPRTTPLPWKQHKRKPKRERRWSDPQPMFNVCICGELVVGRTDWCSERCRARTKYRRRVGIPDDAPLYSSYSRAS